MKKLMIIPFCLLILYVFASNVFALGSDPVLVDPGYDEQFVKDEIASTAKDIWATITVLVQIASVACIVYAGLRYMFSSSDAKADIKQGLIYLTIGAVLVFGATLIIDFVSSATNQIL